MRNSFVFHFEYIDDIPEELQPAYAMNVINYARYGEEPTFDDWRDQRMWNKTKERIDAENEKYERKCKNLRNTRREDPEIFVDFSKKEAKPEPLPEYSNGEPEKPKAKRFIKPTAEEVTEYCKSRMNNIDGQQFVDFYEAKGWKVGREPMKDWKAAVRTWEQRHRESRQQVTRALPEDRLTL